MWKSKLQVNQVHLTENEKSEIFHLKSEILFGTILLKVFFQVTQLSSNYKNKPHRLE